MCGAGFDQDKVTTEEHKNQREQVLRGEHVVSPDSADDKVEGGAYLLNRSVMRERIKYIWAVNLPMDFLQTLFPIRLVG